MTVYGATICCLFLRDLARSEAQTFASGAKGQRFESSRAYQILKGLALGQNREYVYPSPVVR